MAQVVRVLVEDVELGEELSVARLRLAERACLARLVVVDRGPWREPRTTPALRQGFGLLLLSGLLSRRVGLGGRFGGELLGPGDLLRPWEPLETPTLVPHVLEWTVLDDARLAVLDGDVSVRLAMYPEVGAVLFERMIARSRRLAIERAIAGLNRVEHRVVFLLWHLAERWGRVGPDGVSVPVTLSHRMIGQIVSARRPTVSAAVSKLRESGELVRRADGTWLLTGEPPALPDGGLERVLPRRRIFTQGRP
jgi:CRP/FNR family transcriptional regulator, cyclic AMP receptor protein